MCRVKNVVIIVLFIFTTTSVFGQSNEAKQLLLNLEKLAQLKEILHNMYEGYKVVSTGYNSLRNISQGNFQLHKTFFDELLAVNPAIKKYKPVGEILSCHNALAKTCKQALRELNLSTQLNIKELKYLEKVYGSMAKKSLQGLEDLMTVITAGNLRMNDQERIEAIDRIYANALRQLSFTKSFRDETSILIKQRSRESIEVDAMKRLNGIRD